MEALAKQKKSDQTPDDWKKEVTARIYPFAALQGYRGGELHVVGQMECTLSREDYRQKALVLVQKDAPLKLLIGTDLQSRLGFLFLRREGECSATNLLDGERWQLQSQNKGTLPGKSDALPDKKDSSLEDKNANSGSEETWP